MKSLPFESAYFAMIHYHIHVIQMFVRFGCYYCMFVYVKTPKVGVTRNIAESI